MSTASSANRLSGVAILGIILLISMLIVDVIFLFFRFPGSTNGNSGQSPNGSQPSGNTQPAQATATALAQTQVQATSTAVATQGTSTASSQAQTTSTAVSTTVATQPTVPASLKESPVIVPFMSGGKAAQTTRSYTGATTITISGTGQAVGISFSDAFYSYTNGQGKNVPATRAPSIAGLCINSQPIDSFVSSIPPYNPTHIYTVTLNAPGGTLTFGVCDTFLTDNTGAFLILFQ